MGTVVRIRSFAMARLNNRCDQDHKERKQKKQTFFLNDRLDDVVDVMVDNFVHHGFFVNNRSLRVEMDLVNKLLVGPDL